VAQERRRQGRALRKPPVSHVDVVEFALAVPLPTERVQRPNEGETWTPVALHGATADRLREALRDAVLSMERACGPTRRSDPDRAVGPWRALVDAELTLLDSFERDGKRYVVAVENPTREARDLSLLSPRERQVVTAAAAGRTNKLIAYELGLAYSTVRVLLARAAKRLGVQSRRELVATCKAHQLPARKFRSRS
jgi:DNA-binding CsgD family transcriptional regulator